VSATSVSQPDDAAPTSRGRMPSAALVWDKHPAPSSAGAGAGDGDGDARGAVVLVLHGGAVEGNERNRPWSHNVARLVPFARSLRSVPAPLAVARVRFRFRGWNGDEQAPLVDARWALDQVRAAYPGWPVAVVGHSMGGRVALHLGEERDVRLVVALAPWIERVDPRPGPGCRTVVIHGDRDVICALSRSRRLVEELQRQGRDASLIRVARGDHGMLLRPRLWTELTTGVVTGTFADELGIAGTPGAEPRSGQVGAAIALAVHGGGSVIDL
jgi:pimeloyl-ACP methyl ester carboxylesterase